MKRPRRRTTEPPRRGDGRLSRSITDQRKDLLATLVTDHPKLALEIGINPDKPELEQLSKTKATQLIGAVGDQLPKPQEPIGGWKPRRVGKDWGAALKGPEVALLPKELSGIQITVTAASTGKSWTAPSKRSSQDPRISSSSWIPSGRSEADGPGGGRGQTDGLGLGGGFEDHSSAGSPHRGTRAAGPSGGSRRRRRLPRFEGCLGFDGR